MPLELRLRTRCFLRLETDLLRTHFSKRVANVKQGLLVLVLTFTPCWSSKLCDSFFCLKWGSLARNRPGSAPLSPNNPDSNCQAHASSLLAVTPLAVGGRTESGDTRRNKPEFRGSVPAIPRQTKWGRQECLPHAKWPRTIARQLRNSG